MAAGKRQYEPGDDVVRPRRVRHEATDDAHDAETDQIDISGQGSGDPIPTESISFNFGQLEVLDGDGLERPGMADSAADDITGIEFVIGGGPDPSDLHLVDQADGDAPFDDGPLASTQTSLGREGSIEC